MPGTQAGAFQKPIPEAPGARNPIGRRKPDQRVALEPMTTINYPIRDRGYLQDPFTGVSETGHPRSELPRFI